MTQVFIDDREDEHTREVIAQTLGTDDVTIKRLGSGDIVAPRLDAACERKTITDFLRSISNQRLWSQIDRMEKTYEHNCVVVTGGHLSSREAEGFGGHAKAIRMLLGTCAYLNVRPGWSAFWVQSEGDEGARLLAEYVDRYFAQCHKQRE